MAKNPWSSRCFYTDENPHELIAKLGIGKSVTVLSSGPGVEFDVDEHKEPVVSTIKQILELKLAISVANSVSDDSILLINDKLYLLLSAETYVRAGLEAQKTKDGKYFAEFEILKTTSKKTARLFWALENTLTAKYTFLISPQLTQSKFAPRLRPSISVPDDLEDLQDWSNAFLEWCGLLQVQSPLLTEPEKCDSALYGIHQSLVPITTQTNYKKLEGPLSPQTIEKLWSVYTKCDWCVLIVNSYETSPCMWGKAHYSGDSGGYILVHNNGSDDNDGPYGFKIVGWHDL